MNAHNKIGILGGTFNPVHYGHLRAAEEVREKLLFEKVLFIPSCKPPLKSDDLAPAEERYEMTRLSIEANPFFEISDIECKKQGKSYTVETLAALNELYPDKSLYLIMGIDSFLDIPSWRRPERVMDLAHFVVISRPGFSFSSIASMIPTSIVILSEMDGARREVYKTKLKNGREVVLLNVTPMPISATTVRRIVRQGKSIKYLLPDKIESYIISHSLYREGGDDP
ncbi:MAG: nicotinate-nucleotide adenylyltransferase [Thermodesulfovibrionales bacterium]|jgi:nicotinate-nucleotide adenylyltransferase